MGYREGVFSPHGRMGQAPPQKFFSPFLGVKKLNCGTILSNWVDYGYASVFRVSILSGK